MSTSSAYRLAELLGRINDGALIKGRTLKVVLRALQRGMVIPGDNLFWKEMPDGLLLHALRTPAKGGDCALGAEVRGAVLQFTSGGTIGGMIPSNLFGSHSATPAPDVGDLSNFALSSGWNWLVANVTASNGRVTGISLARQSSSPEVITPTEGTPPTEFQVPLFAAHLDGSVHHLYRMFGCGTITLRPRRIFFRVDAEAGCGYPLIHTWTWEVRG